MLNQPESMPITIRCRPLSQKDLLKSGTQTSINIDHSKKELTITDLKSNPNECKSQTFQFETIFDSTASQENVYKEMGFPIVEAFLSGYDAAIFAYGQTGAGKTYTMEGIPESEEYKGIMPRAFEHIFKYIGSTPEKCHSLHASNILFYNEKVRDLLSESPQNDLKVREKADIGVFLDSIKLVPVKSLEELYKQFKFGQKNKTLASSYLNQDCCHSSFIFSLTLESYEVGQDGKKQILFRKLDLVDMGGCEPIVDTRPNYRETITVNRFLMTFRNVLSSLAGNTSHIPYRDSKFTRLLKNTLGGTAATALIGNISPGIADYDISLMTLKFFSRAKRIKNNSNIKKCSEGSSPLHSFLSELNNLKAQMQQIQSAQVFENISFEKIKERITKNIDQEKELANSKAEKDKPN